METWGLKNTCFFQQKEFVPTKTDEFTTKLMNGYLGNKMAEESERLVQLSNYSRHPFKFGLWHSKVMASPNHLLLVIKHGVNVEILPNWNPQKPGRTERTKIILYAYDVFKYQTPDTCKKLGADEPLTFLNTAWNSIFIVVSPPIWMAKRSIWRSTLQVFWYRLAFSLLHWVHS